MRDKSITCEHCRMYHFPIYFHEIRRLGGDDNTCKKYQKKVDENLKNCCQTNGGGYENTIKFYIRRIFTKLINMIIDYHYRRNDK